MIYKRTDEDLNHMNSKQKTAFLRLQKLGCPVKIWWQKDPKFMDYRGYFWIDSEEYDSELFLDYYDNYMGSEKLQSILDKAGLYFEWQNNSVACVYDI